MNNERLSTSTTHELALLQQRIETQQDPKLILDEGGQWLGMLYEEAQQAGNEQGMALASSAWDRMQRLAAHATQMNEVVDGVLAVANAVAAERDKAITEHSDLVAAVVDIDCDHPLVEILVENVQQDMAEYYDEVEAMQRHEALSELGIDSPAAATMEQLQSGDVPTPADLLYLIDALTGLYQQLVEGGAS